MTPVTAIDLEFGDGTYLFDLKLPQLLELQEKCNASIFRIHARVRQGRHVIEGLAIGLDMHGDAYVEDLFETIRLGLIGGGSGVVDGREVAVNPATARKLVERYCHTAPLQESWSVAAAVLGARVQGYTPPIEAEPAERPATPKPKSTRRRSSQTAQSSEPIGES